MTVDLSAQKAQAQAALDKFFDDATKLADLRDAKDAADANLAKVTADANQAIQDATANAAAANTALHDALSVGPQDIAAVDAVLNAALAAASPATA